MSFASRILADSVSPDGARLTTYEATFPRFILAEVNTHRMLSRNSASSRAIPTEKIIQRVIDDPFVPMTFNRRVKGMGVGDALTEDAARQSRDAWLHARDKAVAAAQVLVDLDVDKSRVNRLLEPFMWHTAIITATEWDNFFALRDHEGAAIPMQRIARLMKEAMWESIPRRLQRGEWHLPLVTDFEAGIADLRNQYGAGVSAGRCARSSYSNHREPETARESHDRWEKLSSMGHWSPGEHPAVCVESDTKNTGNIWGWLQLRKHYANEAVFDG